MAGRTGRWPGRPELIAGESLTSWFVRVAAANGHRPRDLYRCCLPAGGNSVPDLDRHAEPGLIHALSDGAGVEAEAIRAASFQGLAGRVFEQDPDGRVILPWLPPAGRQAGKRCFGQQVCPQCLSTDPVPHLRLSWRLAFVTTCATHGALLVDRCGDCGEPLGFLQQDNRSGFRCWSCGSDARRWASVPPPVDTGPLQAAWMAAVGEGWVDLGAYGPTYSFAALDVLAAVMRLLAGGPHAYALRRWVAAREPGLDLPPASVPRVKDIAHLAPRPRSILLAMAHYLVQDWPHRFVAAGKAVGLASSHIRKRHGDRQPFALADAVAWHLDREQRAGHREEVLAAKQVLAGAGRPGTYRNLIALMGTKLLAISDLADPATDGARWGRAGTGSWTACRPR
ncbi:TniQ family protein [Aerophototrophica crusticola]|uniref:TniQ family protein n=1 Tax=Aerophototrophica crusticola TaxID=1709002 RepID=A0A858R4K4_9PROT|nr:TniQ family protein [Rhodospirillaceae bacterium B3]